MGTSTGVARIFQRGGGGGQIEGAMRPSGGRVSHDREIFYFIRIHYKNSIFLRIKCHVLGGRVAFTNPLLPLLKFLLFQSRGAWALVPLSYATVVQPGFVSGGLKRGSEATVSGGGGEFVYENGIFFHIKCHY